MWPSADGGYDDDRAVEEGADKIWGWIVRNGGSQIMSDRPFELMEYLRQSGRHR
jgi:glycerophosphoryl diester phosphodiesterase